MRKKIVESLESILYVIGKTGIFVAIITVLSNELGGGFIYLIFGFSVFYYFFGRVIKDFVRAVKSEGVFGKRWETKKK